MKALILNGFPKDDPVAEKICASLENALAERNYEGSCFNLPETNIAPCMGCFGCWVKTPGECVIDDAGRDVARDFVQSEMVVFLTPVTFGGYSQNLKKAFDRMIPNLLPFFKKVGREIHHKMRYERYPRFLVIGLLAEPDREKEELFKELARRNSLNYDFISRAVGVLFTTQPEDEIRVEMRRLVEIVMEKAGGHHEH